MAGKLLTTLLTKAKESVTEIDVLTLKEKMKRGALVLIDVRELAEWQKGHIEGARHISKGLLECQIEKQVPDQEQEIILHCGGGIRSLIAGLNLCQMGYTKVLSVSGGFGDWVASGGDVVRD